VQFVAAERPPVGGGLGGIYVIGEDAPEEGLKPQPG